MGWFNRPQGEDGSIGYQSEVRGVASQYADEQYKNTTNESKKDNSVTNVTRHLYRVTNRQIIQTQKKNPSPIQTKKRPTETGRPLSTKELLSSHLLLRNISIFNKACSIPSLPVPLCRAPFPPYSSPRSSSPWAVHESPECYSSSHHPPQPSGDESNAATHHPPQT